MRFWYGVFRFLLGLVGLLAGTAWLRRHGAAVFDPVYALAGGDPDVLRVWIAAALGLFFVGLWVWSARRHRPG